MNLTVHNVYFCFSEVGCTISLRDGTPCKEVPAHTPTLFVAQQSDMVCSDPAAVVKEIPNGLQLLHGQMMKEQAAGGLPAGYKRVEYLESSGTQYIQTKILPSLDSVIIIDCQYTKNNNKYVYGSRGTGVVWGLSDAFFWNGGKGFMLYNFPSLLNRVSVENKKDLNGLIINGKLFSSYISESFPPDGKYNDTLTLFSAAYISSFCSARIFSFKLDDEGKKLSFIPCLDPTGAPCMFDLVSRKPFYNSGTGDFTYPTSSTTYALRRVLPDWGKLTENGLRRLYHAPASYKGELYDYALEHGYKPIVESDAPEEGYWAPRWTETEEEIILEWVETEPPMDEFGLPEEDLTETE